MGAHGVGVGEDLARAAAGGQAPGRPDLVGHGDGAQITRPAVAIAGIEGVEDLAVEIGQTRRIEPGAGVAAEQGAVLQGARPDPRVQRLGLGREEEGLVRAHLVAVDDHLGPPVADQGGVTLGFGLGLDEPVAVQVEQIMVVAAAGPGLVPLGRGGVGIGQGAAARGEAVEETLAPVRVLGRDEDDDGVGQPGLGGRVGQQATGGLHGGVGGADLIAVDRIGHPDQDRLIRDQGGGLLGRGAARIGQGAGVGLDLVQPGDVGGRADGGPEQGAALPTRRIVADGDLVGGCGLQRFEIATDVGGARDLLTAVIAQGLADGGDVGGGLTRRDGLDREQGGGAGAGQAEGERTHGTTMTGHELTPREADTLVGARKKKTVLTCNL